MHPTPEPGLKYIQARVLASVHQTLKLESVRRNINLEALVEELLTKEAERLIKSGGKK